MVSLQNTEELIKKLRHGEELPNDVEPYVLEKALESIDIMNNTKQKQKQTDVPIAQRIKRIGLKRMLKLVPENGDYEDNDVVDFIKQSIIKFLDEFIANKTSLNTGIPIAMENFQREVTGIEMATIVSNVIMDEPFIDEFGLFNIRIIMKVPKEYVKIGIKEDTFMNVPFADKVLAKETINESKEDSIQFWEGVYGTIPEEKEAEIRNREEPMIDIYNVSAKIASDVFDRFFLSGINPVVTGLLLIPKTDIDELMDDSDDEYDEEK